MFFHDDVNERTGHRGDIEEPCGPPAGESVDLRFLDITDRQKTVFQANLYIFADLGTLTPFSFTAQESSARISEVEPSGKILDMMPQISCGLCHSLRCLINFSWHSRGGGAGGTLDSSYGLYRFVPPRNGVYLGVKTCEVFLCCAAIFRVRVHYVDFFVFFVLSHW